MSFAAVYFKSYLSLTRRYLNDVLFFTGYLKSVPVLDSYQIGSPVFIKWIEVLFKSPLKILFRYCIANEISMYRIVKIFKVPIPNTMLVVIMRWVSHRCLGIVHIPVLNEEIPGDSDVFLWGTCLTSVSVLDAYLVWQPSINKNKKESNTFSSKKVREFCYCSGNVLPVLSK